jgi:PAS domain S-box-containing protein
MEYVNMPGIGPNDIQNIILDSITEGVFTVDSKWRITSFNRAAEEITGVQRTKAIGRQCRDILRADVCETECALAETIRTGQPIVNRTVHIIAAKGE